MNDDIILYGGGAVILALIAWKFKTGFGKIAAAPGGNGNSEPTLQNRIDYTRSAMNTAYDAQDVSEYLRLQRDLGLLELEIS